MWIKLRKPVVGLVLCSFVAFGAVLYSPASAQAPKEAAQAVIDGPKEPVPPGDLVVLDASNSKAADFTWTLLPGNKKFLTVEGGKKAVFSTGTEGKYTFILSVALGDKVSVVVHEVVVGNPAPPAPTPTPTPTPTPQPAPVVREPTTQTKEAFKQTKEILGTNPTKAKIVGSYFKDFLDVVKPQLKDLSVGGFKNSINSFMTAVFSRGELGLVGAFPGFTNAFDKVFKDTFGEVDGKLDSALAEEFLVGLIWAAN